MRKKGMAASIKAHEAVHGKTDNSERGKADKIAIRRAVLAQFSEAHVFDGFAGSGILFRAVWAKATSYAGCDLRFFRDKRTAFVCDNRRLMRCLDLKTFNVFDFDSYGGPWEQCMILAERRPVAPGERVGLVLTEGSRMKMTFGSMPKLLANLAGMEYQTVGTHRDVVAVVDRALAEFCRRWKVQIIKQWRAESHALGSGRPLYIGLVLEGLRA